LRAADPGTSTRSLIVFSTFKVVGCVRVVAVPLIVITCPDWHADSVS
jgi:hypothetical protein